MSGQPLPAINIDMQIFDGVHVAAALSPPPPQDQRCALALPHQRAFLLIHDHLHADSQRRTTPIARSASPRFPGYPVAWSDVAVDASGKSEQV